MHSPFHSKMMSQISDTAINFAGTDAGWGWKLCFGKGWGWKSSAAGTDGDGKLVSRGRMGMDTVCAVMDGDGLISVTVQLSNWRVS